MSQSELIAPILKLAFLWYKTILVLLHQQVNPLNTNPLNGLEAVTDTFSGFAKTVNVVRNVVRSKNDKSESTADLKDDDSFP